VQQSVALSKLISQHATLPSSLPLSLLSDDAKHPASLVLRHTPNDAGNAPRLGYSAAIDFILFPPLLLLFPPPPHPLLSLSLSASLVFPSDCSREKPLHRRRQGAMLPLSAALQTRWARRRCVGSSAGCEYFIYYVKCVPTCNFTRSYIVEYRSYLYPHLLGGGG